MSRFLKSVDYSNVKVVVIDMTPKYKRLIKTIIPDAHIVIDKFHIQQDIQKAFRKELAQYDNVILYEIRTLLLYKRESLSYEQQQLLNEYISRYPQVSFIYEINGFCRMISKSESDDRRTLPIRQVLPDLGFP